MRVKVEITAKFPKIEMVHIVVMKMAAAQPKNKKPRSLSCSSNLGKEMTVGA